MPPLDPRAPAMPPETPPEIPMEDASQQVPADPLSSPLASGRVEASPEEQAQADEFVAHAWEVIYDDATFPQMLETLKGGAGEGAQGNPIQGLATATEMVMSRVGQAAEDSGQQLQGDVVMFAFGEVLEELAEVSRRAKIKDYAQDRDGLESAYFQALDIYRDRLQKAGVLDQASHQQGLEQLMQADQDGTLEKIMRDLAENDGTGQAGGPELPPSEKKPKRKGMAAAMGAPPAAQEEIMRRVS
jgi:hypothetical protein